MLQEFNIIVKHIRGKDNLIADCFFYHGCEMDIC